MIEAKLTTLVEQAFANAVSGGELGTVDTKGLQVLISRPKVAAHGDFACDLPFKLAAKLKGDPKEVAEILVAHIKSEAKGAVEAEVAGKGFINFRVNNTWFAEVLQQIHSLATNFGRSTYGAGKKALVEYVSANPTGDLHIGHARIAVIGSCLSNLLSFAGFDVTEEFYVNDAGEQVAKLARCAWALYLKSNGKDVAYPEDGYPEESLADYVAAIVAAHKDEFVALDQEQGEKVVGGKAKVLIMKHQEEILASMRIVFDNWYSETPLHESGKVDAAIAKLTAAGLTSTEDGAIVFAAQSLGDSRDRFLTKKDGGGKTYLAADIAYHLEKLERGYDLLINVWGADHHGQVPGLKAAIAGAGGDADKLEVVLVSIVNLKRDGQLVRMSKRMGTVVLLEDLLNEVGADATRYYLGESSPDNPIAFDLELAKKQSRENPAFYIQYAHTRCAGILRKALSGDTPPVAAADWQQWLGEYAQSGSSFEALFASQAAETVHQKALIARLGEFPIVVEKAAKARAVSMIAHYAYDLACDLQKFYETSHVITADTITTKARLGLIVATQKVLANTLAILGISAPETM